MYIYSAGQLKYTRSTGGGSDAFVARAGLLGRPGRRDGCCALTRRGSGEEPPTASASQRQGNKYFFRNEACGLENKVIIRP